MDFDLPEELRLLKENIRRFVDRELIPLEREVVNDIKAQKELPQRLRDKVEGLGLWLYDVPEEFGGLGLGMMAKVVVWSEVSRTTALPARNLNIFGPPVSPILYTLEGRALVAMNRVDDAQKEMALAREALILIPASDADRLRPYSDNLRAEILLSERKSAEGVALMKEIEEQLRASPGPDARSQALIQLDSIARRARETEEWVLAELTAEEMIEQDPSYAGGYYAKGLVA